VSPNRERHYRALFRFCRILGKKAVLHAPAPEVRLCPSRNPSLLFTGSIFSTVAWSGTVLLPRWRGPRRRHRSRPRHSSFPTRSLLPRPPIRHCGWAVIFALGLTGRGGTDAAKAPQGPDPHGCVPCVLPTASINEMIAPHRFSIVLEWIGRRCCCCCGCVTF
jgi:hypothetical protein